MVRKFEFIDRVTGKFSVVEMPEGTSSKAIPESKGEFCRTWIGESGAYEVKTLKLVNSKYIATLLTKGGMRKIKNGEYVNA